MEILELWRLVSRLKVEPRRGWLKVARIGRVESVADHSFGVAILSLFEAERRGYDVERVVKLALIHDLEEAITGDLTPVDKRKLTAKGVFLRREAAWSKIAKMLPAGKRTEYGTMWRDLKTGKTREARLVKELDKLEMALQAWHYEKMGVEHGDLAKFYRSARGRIRDVGLRRMAGRLARGG